MKVVDRKTKLVRFSEVPASFVVRFPSWEGLWIVLGRILRDSEGIEANVISLDGDNGWLDDGDMVEIVEGAFVEGYHE